MVELLIEDRELTRLGQIFQNSPDIFGKAMRSALRRAGGNMRTNLRRGIKKASYLKSAAIASAIGKLQLLDMEVRLTVAGAQKAGHNFRMVPNSITARKGLRSISWPSPAIAIGPGEPLRHPRQAGFFKPFIARINGSNGMYWRERASNDLSMPTIVAPQYFAAFNRVKDPALREAEQTFLKRLNHEIDYRLGALR